MPEFKGWFKQPRASLSELVMLAVLIGIFVYIATLRIWELRVVAEKTGMEHTVAAIQSALGMTLAATIVKEGLGGIARLEGSNPMQLLDPPPGNYIGELEPDDVHKVGAPAWYFDRNNKTLVYRVLNEEYFETPLEGAARARFHIQLNYRDANANGRYDPHREVLTGLALRPLEPYRWRLD